MVFGVQLAIPATAGPFVDGWFCEWLTSRGYRDIALFFVISVFCGIAFGAASVALVTDFVFHDECKLRYFLSVVTAITMSVAALASGRKCSLP